MNPRVRIIETDGDVVELAATTAKGDITVIAEMSNDGNTLILRSMHIDGPGRGRWGFGNCERWSPTWEGSRVRSV